MLGILKMNWKSLLAIFVILSIGLIVMRTDEGKIYFDMSFDGAKVALGNFAANTFNSGSSGGGGLFGRRMPKGDLFGITLDVNKDAFSEQSYKVGNSSIHVSGVCIDAVEIDSIVVDKGASDCVIDSPETKGTYEFTESGSLVFTGTMYEITVDGQKYAPTPAKEDAMQKPLKVSFEIMPNSALLTELSVPWIELDVIDGKISRTGSGGTMKSIEELESEQLKIGGFEGYLKVENSNIISLQGTAVSVAGESEHSSFVW